MRKKERGLPCAVHNNHHCFSERGPLFFSLCECLLPRQPTPGIRWWICGWQARMWHFEPKCLGQHMPIIVHLKLCPPRLNFLLARSIYGVCADSRLSSPCATSFGMIRSDKCLHIVFDECGPHPARIDDGLLSHCATPSISSSRRWKLVKTVTSEIRPILQK